MKKPTLKSYTLASRTKSPHKAKLAKEYAFANTNRTKIYALQQGIRNNSRSISKFEVTSSHKTLSKIESCSPEIGYYSYTNRCGQLKP